jgi:hypothetical protein
MITASEAQTMKSKLLSAFEDQDWFISNLGFDGAREAADKPGWWVSVNGRNDMIISMSEVGYFEIKEYQSLEPGVRPSNLSLDGPKLLTVRRFMTVKHVVMYLEQVLEGQLHIHLKQKAA